MDNSKSNNNIIKEIAKTNIYLNDKKDNLEKKMIILIKQTQKWIKNVYYL